MRYLMMVALVISAVVLSAQTPPVAAGFAGNKEVKIYHLPACKLVLKIKPENKIPFVTKEEAEKAGYAPCKICIK